MSRVLTTTGESDLFWMREAGPFFLKSTGITELLLLKDQGKGVVTIIGHLPDALALRKLEHGDILEVVNRRHGLREEYTAEDAILRLELLGVQKRIPGLVALSPEEDMRLHLEVIAECEVTFLFKLEEPKEA